MEELTTWNESVSKSDKLLLKRGQAVRLIFFSFQETHQETLLFSWFRIQESDKRSASAVCKAMPREPYGSRGGVPQSISLLWGKLSSDVAIRFPLGMAGVCNK